MSSKVNMDTFMRSMKKNTTDYLLLLPLVIFILFEVEVPRFLADMVDTTFGQILTLGIAIVLFFYNPVVGVVALIGAYTLIQRSQKRTGTAQIQQYLPSETHKDRHFNAMNQFPLTLEEEIVNKMVPLVNETPSIPPEYKPITSNTYGASML